MNEKPREASLSCVERDAREAEIVVFMSPAILGQPPSSPAAAPAARARAIRPRCNRPTALRLSLVMAKRKKQAPNRHAIAVASVVSEQDDDGACKRRADAKRLALLLMAVTAVLSFLLAGYAGARIDAVLEESSSSKNGRDASVAPSGGTAKTVHKRREVPMETMHPRREVIDLSQFDGSWEMVTHFSETYDSEVRCEMCVNESFLQMANRSLTAATSTNAQGLHHQLKQLFDPNERAYNPSQRRLPLQRALKQRGGGFDRWVL